MAYDLVKFNGAEMMDKMGLCNQTKLVGIRVC
jgi:hypothetical protein